MMEHSESALYQPDEIKFKENREFTKLYHKRIGTGQEKETVQPGRNGNFLRRAKKYACTTKKTVSDIHLIS